MNGRATLGVAAALLCAVTTFAQAQAGLLSGTVTDSATGEPLGGVRVVALEASRSTFSDERGRFSLTGIATGTLRFTRIGYHPRQASANAGTPLLVTLGATGVPLEPVVVAASRSEQSALDAPAALTVMDRATLAAQPALTPADHLRTAPGVDMADKGLIQHTYSVRGDRGTNSAQLLTLTDYRNADVPSLAFNVSYLFPINDDDIERIELMRGPGAALYGPGADRGVLHILTRSPFESRGGALSFTAGSRELLEGSLRWAAPLGRRLAFKLSGDYVRGRDWPLRDTTEVAPRDPLLERVGGEARLDWRPDAATEVVTTFGMAQAIRIVELGGDVGTAQVRDWRYTTVQSRVRRGRFFANAFTNLSNTGNTYLLHTGEPVVDSSRVAVAQMQDGYRFGGRLDLVYGADLRWTDPRTGGTIDGENERRDDVLETGAYVHGTAALGPRLDAIAALRVDRHSVLHDNVISPRVGFVFHPAARQALRLTYNRAFTSPDANTLFLDIVADSVPGLPMAVRAGSIPRSGYSYRRDCGGVGGLCMRSPFNPDPTQFLPSDGTPFWPVIVQILQANGIDVSGVTPPNGTQVGSNLATLEPDGSVHPTLPADVRDIAPLRRTITNTLELGWKAEWGRGGSIAVDLYTNRISDNLGVRFGAAPFVLLDGTQLAGYLISQGVAPATAAAAATIGAQVPLGIVTPQQTTHPTDALVLTRQGGSYRIYGADLSAEVPLGRAWRATGFLSLVSDDSIPNAGAAGTIVLGVPRTKASLGIEWRGGRGVLAGADVRSVQSYPINSGAYRGRVAAYTLVDARAGIPLGARRTLTIEARNLLGTMHQEFIGAPAIGRLVLTRLKLEF